MQCGGRVDRRRSVGILLFRLTLGRRLLDYRFGCRFGCRFGLGGFLVHVDLDLFPVLLAFAQHHPRLPGLRNLEAHPVARGDGDRRLGLGVDPLPLLRLFDAEGPEVDQPELSRLLQDGENPLQDSVDDLLGVLLGQLRGSSHVADQIILPDSPCCFCHGLVPPFLKCRRKNSALF